MSYMPHLASAAAGLTPRSNMMQEVLERTVNAMLPLFNDDSGRIPESIQNLALPLFCFSREMLWDSQSISLGYSETVV